MMGWTILRLNVTIRSWRADGGVIISFITRGENEQEVVVGDEESRREGEGDLCSVPA